VSKFLIALAVTALALPAVGLAAKPPAPGNAAQTHGKAAPQVLYVLKGKLTAYTAVNGTTNGTVSIQVTAANRHGAALKTQTLQFAVSPATKIAGTVTVNDKGIVKVRGPKNLQAGQTLATVLQANTAWQIVDQAASS
jgi:hypothetical protein